MVKRKFVGFSMFSTKFSRSASCTGWKRGGIEGEGELRLRGKGKGKGKEKEKENEKREGGKVGLGRKRSGLL